MGKEFLAGKFFPSRTTLAGSDRAGICWIGSCSTLGRMSIFRHRRGFTLVELVIVLAIIGVVSAMGVASVRKLQPRFRMIQASKDLQADVSRLRIAAVDSGRETRLLLLESDSSWDSIGQDNVGEWAMQRGDKARASTTWTTLEDGDAHVVISRDGPQELPSVSLVPWSTLSGPATGNADAIVFSPRGFVANPDGDFGSDGYITLTLVNKAALTDGVEDTVSLKIARTGGVSVTSSLGNQDVGTVGSASSSTH